MSTINEFRFIGTVYGNPELEQVDESNYRVWFTLAIKSNISKKTNYVKLLAPSNLWEKSYFFCRNGNEIVVNGEVISKEMTDRRTGSITSEIMFVCSDVLLIKKCQRRNVSEKKFRAIVNSMPLDLNIGGKRNENRDENNLLDDEEGQETDTSTTQSTQNTSQ